jgi:PAS domain S-box-containing protein
MTHLSPEEFDARLQVIHHHLTRSTAESAPSSELLEKLRSTLEELRAAGEELRQQNEELVAAHLQVDEERQRYQDLFQLAPDAYLVTSPSGIISEANDSASRLLGASSSFLRGKPLPSFITPEDRIRFRALLSGMGTNHAVRALPFRMKPRRSEPLDVEITYSPIPDRGARPSGIRWIIRDVSARQRMARRIQELNLELEQSVANRTAALRAAQQLSEELLNRERAARHAAEASEAHSRHVQKLEGIGVLAGGIAHDFNNLLHVILGNADIALSRLPARASAREPLDEVVRATLRAADLTRQLLAYSGKGAFVVGPLDLSREMREMATLLRTAISKQATLAWDLAPDLPTIRADATQVHQVVMNLITNASDALGDAAGTITLRTGVLTPQELDSGHFQFPSPGGTGGEPVNEESGDAQRSQYVYLEVSDTGAGMTPETLSRIFDPFFSTKFSGRGLGLAAVMGIVRAHQGLIRIRTEPGQGTTFRVLFPAASDDLHQSPLALAGQREWRGHGTVLVIDDEDGVREVLDRILRELGFSVRAAADGREALEILDRTKGRFAGVLLDLSMPHMGGQETLRRLRIRYPDLPVIMMSGFTEEAVADRVGDSARTTFLQKPFLAEDLIDAFQRVLQPSG